MARSKRKRRSYGAGEWGRNRVRVFPDPKTGMFQIEWRENGTNGDHRRVARHAPRRLCGNGDSVQIRAPRLGIRRAIRCLATLEARCQSPLGQQTQGIGPALPRLRARVVESAPASRSCRAGARELE